MTMRYALLALAVLVANPVLAQNRTNSDPINQLPPNYGEPWAAPQDRGQEQAAMPPENAPPKRDPGTLRRFNSNSNNGPEVQFEVDRREAEKAKNRQ